MPQSTVKLWFDDGSCVEVRVSAHRKLVRVDSGVGDKLEVLVTGPAPPPLPKGAMLRALLDKPIEDLGLSVRTSNCLGRYGLGLMYVGELTVLTDRDLLRVKNFGRKSLTEIDKKLAEIRLGIGMEREDLEGWLPPAPVVAIGDPPKGATRLLGSFGVGPGSFHPWAVKRLESHGIRSIGALAKQSALDVLGFLGHDYVRFRQLRLCLAEHGFTFDMAAEQLGSSWVEEEPA